MRVLLDTRVLLWALAAPERLPPSLRRLVEESTVLVSTASLWEISIKTALGKLDADAREIRDAVVPAGFDWLPVDERHALAVSDLPPHHRDPFDRMLVTQAIVESAPLLTLDAALAGYGSAVRVFAP